MNSQPKKILFWQAIEFTMQLTPQDLTAFQGGWGEQVTDELKNERTIRSEACCPPPTLRMDKRPLRSIFYFSTNKKPEMETGIKPGINLPVGRLGEEKQSYLAPITG